MTDLLWHGFDGPQLLSLTEWSLLSIYWGAASREESPVKRTETRTSRRIHVALVNLALLLVALPTAELTPRFLPDLPWIGWAGLSIQSAAGLLAIWARQHLAANWSGEISIKMDHQLIRSGPYRVVRHPIYTGMLAMFVGATLISGQYHALVGLLMAGVAYWRKIRLEEASLSSAFGTVYDTYKSQTGSLVPKVN